MMITGMKIINFAALFPRRFHAENKLAAVFDIRMVYSKAVELFAVQRYIININVLRALIFGSDGEDFSAA